MKNALILHGTDGYPTENWFEWLESELKKLSFKVKVPQLPGANKPSIARYNKFLLEEINHHFFRQATVIGHSSGAVAVLGLLEALPASVKVDRCYLVGAFKGDLGWEVLSDLHSKPLDFSKIKNMAKRFIFIHSDNDPYCPLEHAKFLANELGGELIVMRGQKHFSVGTMGEKYKKFPLLLELIKRGA